MQTLCVVDMQEEFSAYEKALPQVIKEVKYAINSNHSIVFLEFKDCGTTLPKLTRLVKGYDKHAVTVKDTQDGSRQFYRTARKRGFNVETVRVVGVNRCQCVFDTVGSLCKVRAVKKIEVVEEGIKCECKCPMNVLYHGDIGSHKIHIVDGVRW